MNNYDLVLRSGFLNKHEKYRIIKITTLPTDFKSFNFTNNIQENYTLKAFNSEVSINKIKTFFY